MVGGKYGQGVGLVWAMTRLMPRCDDASPRVAFAARKAFSSIGYVNISGEVNLSRRRKLVAGCTSGTRPPVHAPTSLSPYTFAMPADFGAGATCLIG